MTDDAPGNIHDYLRMLERVPEIFRLSWDAIAVYDLEGHAILANAVARAMVGTERAAELRGRHFTEHLTPEAATKSARDFAHCVTAGLSVDSESVFVDEAGQPVPVRMRLVPARMKGRIVGVIGFARDERHRRDVEGQFMRSEQQFRSLFENHPDALSLHDLQGRFLRVNAAAERLTGYSVEELIGQTAALLSPTGTSDVDRSMIERGEVTEFEHPIKTKNGSVREIDGRRVPLMVDGKVRGYCTMIRDVTEQRRAARNSARQATRIAELYRIAAAAGVQAEDKIVTALEAGLTELDAAWAYVARLDEAAEDFVYTAGKRAPQLPADAALHVDRERLERALSGHDVFVVDEPGASPRSFSGAPFLVEGKRYGAVVFVHGSEPLEIATTDRDYIRALAVLIGSAIQQGERERRLDTLAFGDALTGLPNRALLQDRLEQTLLFARRHRRSFAAHYVDIDHFKEINDTYGHQVGDAVLIAASAWLRAALRDSDTIGRMGGDEFVVLQPEIDSQRQAEELAAKLCGIRDQKFRIGARDFSITISVGCAVFPVDAENPVDMLRAADSALYEVKHRGRDGYAVGVVS